MNIVHKHQKLRNRFHILLTLSLDFFHYMWFLYPDQYFFTELFQNPPCGKLVDFLCVIVLEIHSFTLPVRMSVILFAH